MSSLQAWMRCRGAFKALSLRGGTNVDSEDENEIVRAMREKEEEDEDADEISESSDEELPEYWREGSFMHGETKLGDQAPEFSLVTCPPGGEDPPRQESLSESLMGVKNAVILVFLPVGLEESLTNTKSYSSRVLVEFNRDFKALTALGTRVLAINRDQPFSNRCLAEKLKLKFPILSDMSLKVSEAYVGRISYSKYLAMMGSKAFRGVHGFKTPNLGVVVVDSMCRIIYKWIATMPKPSTDDNIPAGAPFPQVMPDLEKMKRVILQVCEMGTDVMRANGWLKRQDMTAGDIANVEDDKEVEQIVKEQERGENSGGSSIKRQQNMKEGGEEKKAKVETSVDPLADIRKSYMIG